LRAALGRALQFRAGRRHGRGTELAPNRDVYVGEWVVGLRDGVGQVVLRCGTDGYVILSGENLKKASNADNVRRDFVFEVGVCV
jgi:hypothetical protein